MEAVTLLDYVAHIQEELIMVYSSEEYALAMLDRRIACWSLGGVRAKA